MNAWTLHGFIQLGRRDTSPREGKCTFVGGESGTGWRGVPQVGTWGASRYGGWGFAVHISGGGQGLGGVGAIRIGHLPN